ncbi:DUF2625 domain-containing protein [Chitinophaga eiseniae]|uniref:DUF2625 domain-containing protein n=1 Tax=Chitinophaga eiseniae TaxID=634771 RepID=A0A847SDL9_9BACT|nr:DUF2625 domain-containing protein [Chitinophaga eiseniae]NLR78274.1 DUF2625 domain-containing protein [Chitinophaga eiseniae]
MRTLNELINTKEPGWDLVQEWINAGSNPIDILPKEQARAEQALYQTQVTTRSPMGAIIYETGGLLVDHGWIRVLGSGHAKLDRTLPGWNEGKSFTQSGGQPGFLLIADDVIGGFFAINNGALAPQEGIGSVFYFAPDTLEWENMEISYSDFISFCCTGDIAGFYEAFRWHGWENDVAKINGAQAFSSYPALFTKEGKDINAISRKAVPIEELWQLQMDLKQQMGH